MLTTLAAVLALRRYGSSASVPFALSLAVDLLARQIRVSRARRGAFAYPVSDVERDELDRRQSVLWRYMLRGPAWESFTRPRLEGISASLENKPILSLLGMIVRDNLPLVETYHFYLN